MRAIISGTGFLIDFLAVLFIIIRLYKPTKESTGFNPTTFRGALFWMYVFFAGFLFCLSSLLITDDPQFAGLYGYTLGHAFLYIGVAIYFFAPFSILTSESKVLPSVFALLTLVSGAIITYINWGAYASGDYVPVVGSNQVMVWNPPDLVFFYIIAVLMLAWGVLGAGLFLLHAFRTKNKSVRRRSFYLGIGFLILVFSGPPHDILGIPSIVILITDIAGAIGILLQGYAMNIKIEASKAMN